MDTDQVRQVQQLQEENSGLKKLVAELTLKWGAYMYPSGLREPIDSAAKETHAYDLRIASRNSIPM